jgi:hypothetical protein
LVALLLPVTILNTEWKEKLKNGQASISVGSLNRASSINKIIEVSPGIQYIRVGAKLGRMVGSPLASKNIIYSDVCLTEVR